MLWRGKKSHLNSRTFSRFSRLSRLKDTVLFSLTNKALASSRSLFVVYNNFICIYWRVRSNVFILSSIAINLCFILCCSRNKMMMQDIRKTTTTTYRTQRRISEERSFSLCFFLSWSMRCRWNVEEEECWLLKLLLRSCQYHQLQRATDMKSIFKMTSASMGLCSNLDNIVSDYTHWNLDLTNLPITKSSV